MKIGRRPKNVPIIGGFTIQRITKIKNSNFKIFLVLGDYNLHYNPLTIDRGFLYLSTVLLSP